MRVTRTRPSLLPPLAPKKTTAQLVLEIITDWNEYQVKPMHKGEFETMVSILSPIHRHYWNGFLWCNAQNHVPCPFQDFRWRGLMYNPNCN